MVQCSMVQVAMFYLLTISFPIPHWKHMNFICSMCSINTFQHAFNPNTLANWA